MPRTRNLSIIQEYNRNANVPEKQQDMGKREGVREGPKYVSKPEPASGRFLHEKIGEHEAERRFSNATATHSSCSICCSSTERKNLAEKMGMDGVLVN